MTSLGFLFWVPENTRGCTSLLHFWPLRSGNLHGVAQLQHTLSLGWAKRTHKHMSWQRTVLLWSLQCSMDMVTSRLVAHVRIPVLRPQARVYVVSPLPFSCCGGGKETSYTLSKHLALANQIQFQGFRNQKLFKQAWYIFSIGQKTPA